MQCRARIFNETVLGEESSWLKGSSTNRVNSSYKKYKVIFL